MVSSVIIRLAGVVTKFNTIAKIRKYKKFHEEHHFIPMVMEVHNALGRDVDHFIRECAHFFMIDDQHFIYPCLFAFKFSRQRVSTALQHALTFAIEKKIELVSDACFRTPITIKSHDLHACDIRGAVDEIASYHERDQLFPFFLVLASCAYFGFFWLWLFVSLVMVLTINLLLDFCDPYSN